MSQIRHSPTPPVTRSTGARSLQWRLIAAVVLAVAGAAIYANSFLAPFVFDGAPRIRNDRVVAQIWPWKMSTGFSRPIGFLSFGLNYALGGSNVWGYHAVNLAIHVAAGWLLFDVVRRTHLRGRLADRFAVHAWGLALTIAVVWLVHPLQTNAVTYLYQRVESLMAMFYLATLWCTSFEAPEFMDTLAAAYAESGDFQEAVRWYAKALGFAGGQKELTRELQAHVELYRARKPLRDEPPGEPPAASLEKDKS